MKDGDDAFYSQGRRLYAMVPEVILSFIFDDRAGHVTVIFQLAWLPGNRVQLASIRLLRHHILHVITLAVKLEKL